MELRYFMLTKPEAIIFDWDNTLVNSLKYINIAREKVLNNFQVVKEQNLDIHEDKDAFFAQFGKESMNAQKFFLNDYSSLTENGISPLKGSLEVLKLIESSNIPMALISNKHYLLLEKEVKWLKWESYFCSIIGADQNYPDKPSPMSLHATLEKIGMTGSDKIWLIGDSIVDLRCAINGKCRPILFGEANFPVAKDIVKVSNHQELHHLITSL